MTSDSPRPARSALRQRAARWLFIVVLGYLTLVVVFALLQRSLIYMPSRADPITAASSGLPADRVRDVRLRTADGLELRGWHLLPVADSETDGRSAFKRLSQGGPVVLYFPGNGGNRTHRIDETSILTELGCHVVLFDYRGFGDNPGRPRETKLAADARAVWDFVTEDCDVAPERIVLYGESLGGGVAVRLAGELSRAETPPAGLILRSTFSSLVDTAAHHYPWLPVRLALVERYPSIHHIQHIQCPLLQLHGRQDSIVPLELGQRLFEAAPEHSPGGHPKRFVLLSDADHNDVTLVADDEMRSAFAVFLAPLLAY